MIFKSIALPWTSFPELNFFLTVYPKSPLGCLRPNSCFYFLILLLPHCPIWVSSSFVFPGAQATCLSHLWLLSLTLPSPVNPQHIPSVLPSKYIQNLINSHHCSCYQPLQIYPMNWLVNGLNDRISILIITLWNKCYYFLHFAEVKVKNKLMNYDNSYQSGISLFFFKFE